MGIQIANYNGDVQLVVLSIMMKKRHEYMIETYEKTCQWANIREYVFKSKTC